LREMLTGILVSFGMTQVYFMFGCKCSHAKKKQPTWQAFGSLKHQLTGWVVSGMEKGNMCLDSFGSHWL